MSWHSMWIVCQAAKQTIHMKYQDLFSMKKQIRMLSGTNFAWHIKS